LQLLPSMWSFPSLLEQSFQAQQSAHYAKTGKGKKGKEAAATVDEGAKEEPTIDIKEVEGSMQKAVDHLQATLGSMHTGRASAGMLDLVRVEVYGDTVPMKGVAAISVRDAQMLAVSVFDPSTVQTVEKAIRDSPLGLNPTISNQEILVPVPRPTKESLVAMGKLLKKEGEGTKISVRHVRKLMMDVLKSLSSEDERKRIEKQVQNSTDRYIKEVDSLLANKEQEMKSAL